MEFDFDGQKSRSNKVKHGVDFDEAQLLWDDPSRLEIPARTHDEPRIMIIGKIQQKLWTAIFTRRNHKIRIISVRRSRKEEGELYEG